MIVQKLKDGRFRDAGTGKVLKDVPDIVERYFKRPEAYGIQRTSNRTLAKKWASSGKMITSVLHGPDMKYWVAPSNKIESQLIKAGLERA